MPTDGINDLLARSMPADYKSIGVAHAIRGYRQQPATQRLPAKRMRAVYCTSTASGSIRNNGIARFVLHKTQEIMDNVSFDTIELRRNDG
jgi:hypothetical protein